MRPIMSAVCRATCCAGPATGAQLGCSCARGHQVALRARDVSAMLTPARACSLACARTDKTNNQTRQELRNSAHLRSLARACPRATGSGLDGTKRASGQVTLGVVIGAVVVVVIVVVVVVELPGGGGCRCALSCEATRTRRAESGKRATALQNEIDARDWFSCSPPKL